MIGIDLTRVSRFKNKSINFVKKILHPAEILEWQETFNKELFLATRWALKEALYKADNKNYHFNKINFTKTNKGNYQYQNFSISSSKEGDYVIAIVLKVK